MRRSAFASVISTRSIVDAKNAHCEYISRSIPLSPLGTSASSMPSHEGNIKRVCVHANCHGIARRLSTPFPGVRRAGRLPMLTLRQLGLGCRGAKIRNEARDRRRRRIDMTIARVRRLDPCRRAIRASAMVEAPPQPRAWPSCRPRACGWQCRRARTWPESSRPVRWRATFLESSPGGCDWIARYVGPPPRPMLPPRPWKSVRRTPACSQAATTSSCARYSAQSALRRPASLAESE